MTSLVAPELHLASGLINAGTNNRMPLIMVPDISDELNTFVNGQPLFGGTNVQQAQLLSAVCQWAYGRGS